MAAEERIDLLGGRELERSLHSLNLLALDLVQGLVAAEHDGDERGGALVLGILLLAYDHEGLRDGVRGNPEELRNLVNGVAARGRDGAHGLRGRSSRGLGLKALGELDVRGVVGPGGERDDILSGVGEDLELVG